MELPTDLVHHLTFFVVGNFWGEQLELIILAYWDQSGKWSLTYYGKTLHRPSHFMFSHSASGDGWIGLEGFLRLFINISVIGILSCWLATTSQSWEYHRFSRLLVAVTTLSPACGLRPGLAISNKLDRILLETKFISTFLTLQEASLKRKLYNYDK